jgi:hypothetical protein
LGIIVEYIVDMDTLPTNDDPMSKIPKSEPHKPQCCPTDYGIEGHCCEEERGEPLPVGVAILDLPLKERKKHMWLVPKQCRKNPEYEMEPDEYKEHVRKIKAEPEEKRKKEEKEKKKKDDDKDATIQQLIEHVANLTNQVNKLTEQMKK